MTKTRKKNGFTLIEALVSISIFLMVSTAVTTTFFNTMQNQRYAKELTIASYLASAQIEVIRAYRDTKRMESESDPTISGRKLFPGVCRTSTNGCTFDPLATNLFSETKYTNGTNGGNRLYLSSSGYTTDSSAGVATPFRAILEIDEEVFSSNGFSRKTYIVTSTIRFDIPSGTKEVILKEVMYDLPNI